MRRVDRNERGFGLIEAFVAALIAAAGGIAIGAAVVTMSDTSRAAEKQAKPVAQVPFSGPTVPNAKVAQDCYLGVGAKHRMTYTSGGWREERDHPQPALTGDLAKDRGALEVWKYGLENYIADFTHEFEACDKSRPEDSGGGSPPDSSTTSTTDPNGIRHSVNATYALRIESKSANCTAQVPTSLSAQLTDELVIFLPYGRTTLRATGRMSADGYFNASGRVSVDQGAGLVDEATLTVQGKFELIDGRPGIRSGAQYEISADGQSCAVTFEGRT